MPMTTRLIGFLFLGLTLLTAGLTVQMMSSTPTHHHEMDPSHYLMVLIPASVTIAWPFANGWRPWKKKATDLDCASCGTQWLPSESAGACPVCGNLATATATA